MNACTIHLVRHAEHRLQGHTLAGRMKGVALSETGQLQVTRLAQLYAATTVRAVLTSPVQRAVETAGPIAASLGIAPTIEPALEEIDFGQWSGQSFDALANAPGWPAWNSARSLAPTPGGEGMLAAQARAVGALLQQRQHGGTVIAISHSDVIKAVLAYVLGMPLDLMHRLEIAPASRSVLVLGDDFARVDSVNLPA